MNKAQGESPHCSCADSVIVSPFVLGMWVAMCLPGKFEGAAGLVCPARRPFVESFPFTHLFCGEEQGIGESNQGRLLQRKPDVTGQELNSAGILRGGGPVFAPGSLKG